MAWWATRPRAATVPSARPSWRLRRLPSPSPPWPLCTSCPEVPRSPQAKEHGVRALVGVLLTGSGGGMWGRGGLTCDFAALCDFDRRIHTSESHKASISHVIRLAGRDSAGGGGGGGGAAPGGGSG